MKKSLTLIELLIVVIVVGILVGFGLVTYPQMVNSARRAKANHAISLIAEAEKIVHDETGGYEGVASNADITTLSTDSGIDLTSITADVDWSYTVTTAGPTATATGKAGRPVDGEVINVNF
jgi:Tfp pilus assembly protein PilE